MLKKSGLILGVLVLAAVLAVGAGYYYFIRLPLPAIDGELQIKGLRAQVKVLRDRWGVPHIYADNEHDLFLAQGFVQAQDRLWQMETNRRAAAGRLSEIFGPELLETDRLLRTFGFMRAARRDLTNYSASELEILQAFSAGVNAFTESRGGRLPLEFRLLRFRPEPWRPEDSLAWGMIMAFSGGMNWQEELVRAMMVQKLGRQKTLDLLGQGQPTTPTIIPPGQWPASWWPDSRTLTAGLPLSLGGCSNNWAVSGSRTNTGAPLLANDMHLPVNVPSMWYEIHLTGGGLDVTGLSLPGVPLVIAGHNQNLAWGITFAYIDVQDIFLERMSAEKRGLYLYKGEWLQAELIQEPIKVKDREAPFIHEVWLTRHGPLITPCLPEARPLKRALALKWSAYDPGGKMISGMYGLNKAQNWEDFKAAAQDWPEPSLNLAYADREGHIGYVLAGRIPLRAKGLGNGPFPGWTGEYEWTGYLPKARKPFLLDPPQGFLATANNRVIAPDSPLYIGADYDPGLRAARIEQVLAESHRVSRQDFRYLQGDLVSLTAGRFMTALKGFEGRSPKARGLLKQLRAWDMVMGSDSSGAAVYAVLFQRIMENTFRDEMGPLAGRFFGEGLIALAPLTSMVWQSRVMLLGLMSDPGSAWFDDIKTTRQENLADIVEKSLNETASFLEEKLGPEPSAWSWGRLHQVEFKHPLGQAKPLDKLLNLGPFPGAGGLTTVQQSALKPGMDFNLNGW
ncbi:MAG: penicillin acylase family protein, partial [Thermodesulfobacteriota bacterium]|nr:penicillin acylase family protein [Thermodesulfobacteriota bacterium]